MRDKVALITGGTVGIGRATAIEFGTRGVNVAITGRRESEGEKTAAMVRETGAKAIFIKSDVSDKADCKHMVDRTLEEFGHLDFAFNNAGIEGAMAPITEETDENFHHVMNINVLGVLNSMQFEIQAMLQNGGGAIVNNASIAGMIAMPGIAVYSASKHAVLGLTKAAGLEYAKQGIRVNAVSPAAIQTEMFDRFTGGEAENVERLAQMHPVGRAGIPKEIAATVCFLCSEGASFITGTNLPVDGGFTAQ